MSRLMSHRQMKAAEKAVGIMETRVRVLEGIVGTLLNMAGLQVVKNEGQLMIQPIPQPEPAAEPAAVEPPLVKLA
jgi:hypothetical protein